MAVYLGRDISCTSSLRTGRFSTGARLVGEAIYRRLVTPRGTLRGSPEEESYGLDLSELVGTVSNDIDEASLPGRIASEITKDERIDTVDVNVVRSRSGPASAFKITVSAVTGAGPFKLVILASAVTVELLDLQETA